MICFSPLQKSFSLHLYRAYQKVDHAASMGSHGITGSRALDSVKPTEGENLCTGPQPNSLCQYLKLSSSNTNCKQEPGSCMGTEPGQGFILLGDRSCLGVLWDLQKGNDSLTKWGTDSLTHSFLI